jgi:hypothetical protein
MQKRIGEGRVLPEVGSLTQYVFQRMTRRQCAKRSNEVSDSLVSRTYTEAPAKLLEHVNAGPSVGRIYHHMHCRIRSKYVVQSGKAGVRIWKMMKNSGADDLIEAHSQLVYMFDWKLMDLKIFQIVFALEFLRTLQTRRADVDASNLSFGPT